MTKEWFQLLIREIFQPAFGMFEYVEETREYWLSPAASRIGVAAEDFRMVGTVLGLAIFNGVILDVHFPLVRPPPPTALPATHSLHSLRSMSAVRDTTNKHISFEDITSWCLLVATEVVRGTRQPAVHSRQVGVVFVVPGSQCVIELAHGG